MLIMCNLKNVIIPKNPLHFSNKNIFSYVLITWESGLESLFGDRPHSLFDLFSKKYQKRKSAFASKIRNTQITFSQSVTCKKIANRDKNISIGLYLL